MPIRRDMQPIRIDAHLDNTALIAPCGLNCSLCRAHMRERNACPGCRGDDRNKSNACINCPIKNCREMAERGHRYCYSCAKFPCPDLLHLDTRYRTNYGLSVIANLKRIKEDGVERFLVAERTKWACPKCGAVICMHKPQCVSCGNPR